MNGQRDPARTGNPFAAARVRPGATEFLFPSGQPARQLVDRLQSNCWRGQIIGPHGSGKSALLATLLASLEAAGRHPVLVELHDGQRRLPIDLKKAFQEKRGGVLIVDGYEQLGFLSRIRAKRFCQRHGLGLLVTAHRPVGLPDLFHTRADLPMVEALVNQLLVGYPAHVTAEDVAGEFASHHGDIRETLFALYDLHETRSRG